MTLKATACLVLLTFSTLQTACLTADTAWAEEQGPVSGLSPVPENPVSPFRKPETLIPDSFKSPSPPPAESPWGLPAKTSQEFLLEQESPLSKEPVSVELLTMPQVEPPVPLERESHPLAGFTVQATTVKEKKTSEKEEKEGVPDSRPAITTGNLKDVIPAGIQPLPASQDAGPFQLVELASGFEKKEHFSGNAVLSVVKVKKDPLEEEPLEREVVKASTGAGGEGNYFSWEPPAPASWDEIKKKPGKKKTKNQTRFP